MYSLVNIDDSDLLIPKSSVVVTVFVPVSIEAERIFVANKTLLIEVYWVCFLSILVATLPSRTELLCALSIC